MVKRGDGAVTVTGGGVEGPNLDCLETDLVPKEE